MLREELLILRKTLIELLDKGFIRVSNLLGVASILFVQKLRDSLYFYVDYRGLNKIT